MSENNDETVVMPNKTIHKQPPNQVSSMIAATREVCGNLMPQYLKALTIATELAIADTGTMSIIVMEGVDVKNKQLTKNPLTINLPDGRQVESTHVCEINIPGLPTTLKGHIVPNLAIALLFSSRVLGKDGCKVVFSNEKCSNYLRNR